MILIGEKLNSSIPKTLEALEQGNEDYLVELIRAQAGTADFLDINTAMCADELQKMKYVIKLALAHSDCGLMIDTTDASVMEGAIPCARGREIILNSLTLTQRFDTVSKLAARHACKVVALPIDDDGIPQDAQKRTANALLLVDKLTAAGIPEENIFIDVLAEALSVQDQSAKVMLDTITSIRQANQRIHLTCGLSNLSFGLPGRRQINCAAFLAASVLGMDSPICDAADTALAVDARIAQMLLGQDEYCMDYITYTKKNRQ